MNCGESFYRMYNSCFAVKLGLIINNLIVASRVIYKNILSVLSHQNRVNDDRSEHYNDQ